MRHKRNTRAFTLVELLVVISIIALLVAILLPSLATARDQAKNAVCKTNLKQQLLAFNMYVEDHDEDYPTDYTILDALGDPYPSGTYGAWGGKVGVGSSYTRRLLNPYMGRTGEVSRTSKDSNIKVFLCPADEGGNFNSLDSGDPPAKAPVDFKPGFWTAWGTSYLPNPGARGSSYRPEWMIEKKVTIISRPARFVIVGDWSFSSVHAAWYGSNSGGPYTYAYTHNKNENGWGNVGFADSHVGFHKSTNNDDPDYPVYNYQTGPGWTFLYD